MAVQGTLEAKKTLRQPLDTLRGPVTDQLYQQTKVAHLMVAIFVEELFPETPINDKGGYLAIFGIFTLLVRWKMENHILKGKDSIGDIPIFCCTMIRGEGVILFPVVFF